MFCTQTISREYIKAVLKSVLIYKLYLEGYKETTKIIKKTTIFLLQKKYPSYSKKKYSKKIIFSARKSTRVTAKKSTAKKVFLQQKKYHGRGAGLCISSISSVQFIS